MLQCRLNGIKATLLFAVTIACVINILEARQCHHCSGINCQRTTSNRTVNCTDSLDVCASIFTGEAVEAQGCLEELHDHLRAKCKGIQHKDCLLCDDDLCNNVGPLDYQCVHCDSTTDANCYTSPEDLRPITCEVTRSNNAYCFVRVRGERTTRGCAAQLAEQIDCLNDADCLLCSPFEVHHCNRVQVIADDLTSTTSSTPTPTTSSTNSPPTSTNPDGDTSSSSSSTTSSSSSSSTTDPVVSTSTTNSPPSTENPGGGSNALKINSLQILFTLLMVILVFH